MPRADYKTCKLCGRHALEVGSLSRTRLCEECSERVLRENVNGIHTQSGVAWARWRVGMVSRALRDRPELVNALIDAGAFAYSDDTEGAA